MPANKYCLMKYCCLKSSEDLNDQIISFNFMFSESIRTNSPIIPLKANMGYQPQIAVGPCSVVCSVVCLIDCLFSGS